MKARIVHASELGGDDIAAWQRLQDASSLYRSPFYSPYFTRAIGMARSDAFVAVLEQGAETIGFLPFHRLAAGVAKPIGGQISDYHGPILAENIDASGTEILRACKLTSYDFNHLPVEQSWFSGGAYRTALSRQIDLACGYQTYAEARTAVWKKTIKETTRRLRKAEREIGPVRFSFHEPSDDIYRQHVALKNRWFAKNKIKSVLDLAWVDRAISAIRQTDRPDFSGVLTTVHAGDRLLGAHFGVRSRTVLHWWFPSYALELAAYGSGMIVLSKAALEAEKHGLSLIDFGLGDQEYKLTFANAATELCEGSFALAATRPGLIRSAQRRTLGMASQLPLGLYEDHLRRVLNRFISGTRLPS